MHLGARMVVFDVLQWVISVEVLATLMEIAEVDESHGGGFMNPENYNRLLYQSLTR